MRNALLTVTLLLVACSRELPAEHLSELGFYSKPSEIIATLGAKASTPAEHYLLGRAFLESKDYRLAVLHFANSAFKGHFDNGLRHFPIPVYRFLTGFHFKSKFYPDAACELAKLYYMYREHEYAVKFADLVPKNGSGLYRDAMLVKAQSLVSLGRKADALGCLSDLLKSYSDPGSLSIIHIRIASIRESEGDGAGALAEYGRAVYPDPSGWQAVVAANKIALLIDKNTADFTSDERISIAEALYHGGKYREAAALITDGGDQSGGFRREQLLVRCLTRSGKAAELPGSGEDRVDLVKVHGDELWSMGRKAQAIGLYMKIIQSKKEPQAREAMERTARYMGSRKSAGSREILEEYAEKYPADPNTAEFLWLLGREAIRKNDTGDALRYLAESVKSFPESSDSGNCRFWLYRLKSAAGDSAGAMKIAEDMAFYNPDSSYTWRLFSRLAGESSLEELEEQYRKASGESAGRAMLYHMLLFIKQKDIAARTKRIGGIDHPKMNEYGSFGKYFRSSPPSGTRFPDMEKYFETGDISGIYREMQLVPDDERSRRELYRAVGYFGRKYGYAHLGVYAAIELMRLDSIKENIAVMPEDAVRTLLPKPFEKCVKESAGRFKVDEAMIYSLIKAESLFNHTAVSSAGAVGLMQLMPATARGIARDISIPKGYDLKDPCTSVLFGTQYISWLRGFLEGNFDYMVAGYNGGAGNVLKWKRQLDAPDMDYYMEFVPFEETRFYILRTGKFLEQYRAVYGE